MEYNLKPSYENYELILLNEKHIKTLFEWNIKEEHFEYYTCRPVKSCQFFDEYTHRVLKSIAEKKEIIYVLVKTAALNTPLGKLTLFDLNPRNHSAEFGYYLPKHNRGKGLGSIIISKFIEKSFNNYELNLNKLYATTSSNNYSSIKLLEKNNFKLDGRLREHYWINENKFDQLIYSILKQEWINK